MARHKPTRAERDDRIAARWAIIQLANRHAWRRAVVPYGMRHIQQAVCVVRRLNLGKSATELIERAGYRP